MKLYDFQPAPNCRRARMFMAEKGIDVSRVEVNIRAGETQTDAFFKLNPSGGLPVLELDDGTVIAESMAISRYFEETKPQPALMGESAVEKATVEMWNRRVELEGLLAAAETFRNTSPAFVGRALAGFREPIAQMPALAERGKQRVARFYRLLEERLAKSEYLAGAEFSVADITALCTIDFAARASDLGVPADCPNVQRWHKAVSARPSAKA